MAFIDEIKAKAKANKKVIVLPESEDERTYRAAAAVLAEDIANIVIIGNVDDVNGKAAQYGVDISKATVIDPATSDKLPAYIDKLVELRQKKGMTPVIIATKKDKIKVSGRDRALKDIREGLGLKGNAEIIAFSSVTKEGREEIWEKIRECRL